MAQIIVNPSEQRAFANGLEELVRDMRGREKTLSDRLAALRKSWQDDQAKQFANAQEDMALNLKVFYNRSELFAQYLRDKAAAAERYLDCGG